MRHKSKCLSLFCQALFYYYNTTGYFCFLFKRHHLTIRGKEWNRKTDAGKGETLVKKRSDCCRLGQKHVVSVGGIGKEQQLIQPRRVSIECFDHLVREIICLHRQTGRKLLHCHCSRRRLLNLSLRVPDGPFCALFNIFQM